MATCSNASVISSTVAPAVADVLFCLRPASFSPYQAAILRDTTETGSFCQPMLHCQASRRRAKQADQQTVFQVWQFLIWNIPWFRLYYLCRKHFSAGSKNYVHRLTAHMYLYPPTSPVTHGLFLRLMPDTQQLLRTAGGAVCFNQQLGCGPCTVFGLT